MTKFCAGIGARNTPFHVLQYMKTAAMILDQKGYVLRSEGAESADSAFESGAKNKEIILPFPNHRGNNSELHPNNYPWREEELTYCKKIVPYWNDLSDYVANLHGRNGRIIRGINYNSPVEFVLCWTANGKAIGDTGVAIKMAMERNIPVYNYYHQEREINSLLNK